MSKVETIIENGFIKVKSDYNITFITKNKIYDLVIQFLETGFSLFYFLLYFLKKVLTRLIF